MDDSLIYSIGAASGGRISGHNVAKNRAEAWSCVDYVDFPAEKTGSTAQRVGALADGSTLSRRFANLRGANTLREDTPRTRRELWTNHDGTFCSAQDCTESTDGKTDNGTRATGGGTKTRERHTWYANKANQPRLAGDSRRKDKHCSGYGWGFGK